MIELNNGSKSLIEEKEFDPYGNGYLIKPYDPDSESNATLDAKSYKPSLSMDFAYCSNKIGISNPQIRSNLFGKHILYCISGKDSIGGFNVYRRYKEFRSLYLVLLKEWPGCCIPKIAPKKALGNLDSSFIENRRSLLESFINDLSKSDHLYMSEECQLFLRGPPLFYQSEVISKPPDYIKIAAKYEKIFGKYASFCRTQEIEREIRSILCYLNSGISNIEDLYAQSIHNSQSFEEFDKETNKLLKNINNTLNYFENPSNNVKNNGSIESPYKDLRTWCNCNLLYINGFIECIYKQYELQKTKYDLESKLEEAKENASKIQKGKKKVIQYFNRKPNEFYLDKSELEIKRLTELIASYNLILNISSALVVHEEYSKFKIDKKNEFLEILKTTYGKNEYSFGVLTAKFKDLVAEVNEE